MPQYPESSPPSEIDVKLAREYTRRARFVTLMACFLGGIQAVLLFLYPIWPTVWAIASISFMGVIIATLILNP